MQPVFVFPVLLAFIGCGVETSPPAAANTGQDPPPGTATAPACAVEGRLAANLYGSLEASVALAGEALDCDSMPRPDGAGLRLRFAGNVDGQRLAVIVAIPALLPPAPDAAPPRNLPSNLTLSIEGSGRFFSTPDLADCFSDIDELRPLANGDPRYRIAGRVSCTAPLGEINGDGAVTVTEIDFAGVADWRSS